MHQPYLLVDYWGLRLPREHSQRTRSPGRRLGTIGKCIFTFPSWDGSCSLTSPLNRLWHLHCSLILFNDLNKNFDMCSLYSCMRVRVLSPFSLSPSFLENCLLTTVSYNHITWWLLSGWAFLPAGLCRCKSLPSWSLLGTIFSFEANSKCYSLSLFCPGFPSKAQNVSTARVYFDGQAVTLTMSGTTAQGGESQSTRSKARILLGQGNHLLSLSKE